MSQSTKLFSKQAQIHLVYQHPAGLIDSVRPERDEKTGLYMEVTRKLAIACDLTAIHARSYTDVATAVTCPLCKKTPAYKKLMKLQNRTPDDLARAAMRSDVGDETPDDDDTPDVDVEVLPPSALAGAKPLAE